MSIFDAIFGRPEAWYGGPVFAPQLTGKDLEYAQRALALHPDSHPQFNLQPTIDMLKLADMYGLEVKRKPDNSTAERL